MRALFKLWVICTLHWKLVNQLCTYAYIRITVTSRKVDQVMQIILILPEVPFEFCATQNITCEQLFRYFTDD